MSLLIYGAGSCGESIALDYILTQSFDEEPQYNGPDYLYTKQTVEVRALLNQDIVTNDGETPAAAKTRIEAFLWCPRKRLIFEVNGEELIHSPATGNIADENYGPKPEHVGIEIFGHETFYIHFRVTTWVKKCLGSANVDRAFNPILSHRWSEESTIDNHFLTVKKRTGKMIFTTSLKKLANPDDYRWIAVCPLIKGCVRESIRCAINEDYNELAYEVVDREVNQIPPRPAVDMRGFSEITTNKGAVHYHTVSVTLTGAKGTPKKNLIDTASAVCLSRISTGLKGKWIIDNATVTDAFEDNQVTMKIRAMINATDKNKQGVNALFNSPFLDRLWGSPADQMPLDPGSRGTAGIELVGPQLVDLCCCPSLDAIIGNIQGKNIPDKVAAVAPAQVIQVNVIPDFNIGVNPNEQKERVYSGFTIDLTHATNTWKLQLPIASSKAAACSFPQVAAPTMQVQVDVECESIGAKPHLPDPHNVNPNMVLLTEDEKIAAPERTTDNNLVYHCRLKYVFGIVNPAKQALAGGILPWVNMPWSDTVYGSSEFRAGLISS